MEDYAILENLIDYNRIRLPEEQKARKKWKNLPTYKALEKTLSKDSSKESQKLLREGVQIYPGNSNEIFQKLKTLPVAIIPHNNIIIYNTCGRYKNASVSLEAEGKILIAFEDGLTNILSDFAEIFFILGHEIGHYALGHFNNALRRVRHLSILNDKPPKESLGDFLDITNEDLRNNINKLYALEELSADRFGLLFQQNFEASIKCLIYLNSGRVGNIFTSLGVQAFLEQGYRLVSTPGYFFDPSKIHPDTPLRAIALDLFYKSEACSSFNGKPKEQQLSLKDVNNTIYNWLFPEEQTT